MRQRGQIRQVYVIAVLALSVRWCIAAPAFAAPPRSGDAASAQDPPEYKLSIQRAVEEFDTGNYTEARALFTRAHELAPNARTYRGLGLVAFELRNYGVCVESLEAALASTIKPLTGSLREKTEELLARARAFIARVELKVSPSAATVFVDGVPVQLAPGQALTLEMGEHLVEVRAAGYLPEKRALNVVGGEQLRLEVKMQEPEEAHVAAVVAPRMPAAQPAPPDAAPRRRWVRSPWLWVGVAVLAVGAGSAVWLLRPSEKTKNEPPVTTANTPPGGVVQALGSW